MIIEALMTLIVKFLGLILSPIDIPSLPEGVASVIQSAASYLHDGLAVFAAFVHLPYLLSLFGIVIIIEAGMLIYKFVRWLLQKIPMASIE